MEALLSVMLSRDHPYIVLRKMLDHKNTRAVAITLCRSIDGLVILKPSDSNKHQMIRLEKLLEMPLLENGMHTIQLRESLKTIPHADIFLQFYDDLKWNPDDNPDDTFPEVQQFLGL